MPTYPSSTSSTLKLTSSFSADTKYGSEAVNTIILSDVTSIHTVYKIGIIDTFSITESITAINSAYVKRITDGGIILSDTTHVMVLSLGDPNIKSDINITDEALSNILYQELIQDDIIIDDDPIGNILYTSVPPSNNISLSDTVTSRILKDLSATFKNAVSVAVGVSEVTLYTCSANSAEVVNICLANKHTDTITVDIILYKSGSTARYILKDVEIGLKQSFVINNSEHSTISLMKTDEIRIISDVASSLDVYAAIVEI